MSASEKDFQINPTRIRPENANVCEIANPLEVMVAGETFYLLPERAVYWPRERTLLVSDIHLGKSAAFRNARLPAPDAVMHRDLQRLTHLCHRWPVRRLLVLGDLIHARTGQTASTIHAVTEWRSTIAHVTIALAPGNHDRNAGPLPTDWNIVPLTEVVCEPPFIWKHDPCVPNLATEQGYIIGGHWHPHILLRGPGRDRLRARCFIFGAHRGILPAFGDFTGGVSNRASPSDRVFVIAGNRVIEMPPTR